MHGNYFRITAALCHLTAVLYSSFETVLALDVNVAGLTVPGFCPGTDDVESLVTTCRKCY